MACPLAEYSVGDDQGFPQSLYMRKLHIVPRFRGIQTSQTMNVSIFFLMECESLFLFFSEGFLRKGYVLKSP